MKGWLVILVVAAASICSGIVGAWAQKTNYLGTVFLADSTTVTQQLKVNSDGSINVVCQ